MRLFLRVVKQHRWFKQPDESWLEDGELKGDALSDIQTQRGQLSVYRVANEADMQRVAVALAANRQDFSNMDYAVFADSDLEPCGITVRQTEGETPDMCVNDLHYELGKLTVNRLGRLAAIISAGKHKRIQRKQIETLLHEAARTGQLDRARIKSPKITKSLPWGV